MISKEEFWKNITAQLDTWIESKYTPNGRGGGTRFQTGYPEPYRPNESISKGDFAALDKDWRNHCRGKSLDCNVAASFSGRDEGVWDFIAHPYGAPKTNFCYHIVVAKE